MNDGKNKTRVMGRASRMAMVEKPKNFKESMFRLVKELGNFRIFVFIAIILAVASSILSIYAPTGLKNLTDEMTKGLMSGINLNNVKNIVIILAVVYIISAVATFVEALLMTDVSNKFARRLRESISLKINKLPLSYFDNNRFGDTLSRVTNDVDTIAQSMNQSLASLVSNVVLFVGTLIMMLVTNVLLAITAIIASILGFIVMFLILGRSQKYFKARQEELGKLNSHIEEAYSGLKVIKLYNGEELASNEFAKLNKNVKNAEFKSQFFSGIMMPLMGFVGNFGYVAVCIIGALLTMNGTISFGVIVAFITYVRMFTSPLSQIAQSFTSLQSTAAAGERVFSFLDETEMSEEDDIKTYLDKENIVGNVEFNKVTFSYDGTDTDVIKNFNAHVKAGEKIAIVGPTGAGKTTLVNLLMKFYDIKSGSIKIDGIDIKDIKRNNIHELFTMVLQDTWVYEASIKDNIIFNRKDVGIDEVKEVCKQVGLHYFIKSLPNGYDSLIGENDTLSQGQKQLLTIARAMISKTPFLILDEATSNVDTRTEELVQKAMDKLMEGKTSFIIAHRLSTIKNADLILVMNNGNIIEQGNHEELMKKNGFYADLYNSQFEL